MRRPHLISAFALAWEKQNDFIVLYCIYYSPWIYSLFFIQLYLLHRLTVGGKINLYLGISQMDDASFRVDCNWFWTYTATRGQQILKMARLASVMCRINEGDRRDKWYQSVAGRKQVFSLALVSLVWSKAGRKKKSTNETESFWMGVNKKELHSKKRPRELRMINCQDSLHALLLSP